MTGAGPAAERPLTEAQTTHLRRLYAAFEQAQRELNDFATYLMAEHGIGDAAEWQLSRDLTRFVRVRAPEEPPSGAPPEDV